MTLLNRIIPFALAALLSACIELPEASEPEAPDAGVTPDAGPQPDSGVPADTSAPTITSTSPAHGSTHIPISNQFLLTFSEPMNVGTVQVTIAPTVALSASTWANGNTLLTLQPTAPLAQNTTYTLTVDGKDVAGNLLTDRKVFSFSTTGPAPDTIPPTILSTTPSYSAIGVARDASITVTFSEPMDQPSVRAAFAITAPPGFTSGAFGWNAAGTEMTFNPDTDFPHGTEATWSVSSAAKDASGNSLENNVLGNFRTIRKMSLVLQVDSTTTDSLYNYTDDYSARFRYNVGDDDADNTSRTFFGFDLSGLPQDLTQITSAQLRLRVTGEFGSPFAKLGNLLLESVYYGPTIDRTLSDYDAPVLAPSITLTSFVVGNESFIDVVHFVRDDWGNRNTRSNHSEFRLRFSTQTNSDGSRDFVYFEREDLAIRAEIAKLFIDYEYP